MLKTILNEFFGKFNKETKHNMPCPCPMFKLKFLIILIKQEEKQTKLRD